LGIADAQRSATQEPDPAFNKFLRAVVSTPEVSSEKSLYLHQGHLSTAPLPDPDMK
jgi:hypothetical protein